jgi:type IV secretory pathway TraG/TraD family ATPase VirD4
MKWLWFTGIWTYPLLAGLLRMAMDQFNTVPREIYVVVVYVLPVIFPIIITWTNIERKQRGQTDFSFAATYGLADKDERKSKAYLDAAYPEVPKQYASKVPTGLVLGKHKGKYAYCPVIKDGINGFVVGTPGAGKSVLLLGWLYSMLFRDEIAKKGRTEPGRAFNYALVDIKGELAERILGIKLKDYKAEEHKDFQVVAPAVDTSYGYDPFYKIHRENVSETEIIKAVTDIADALVVSTGENSAYFTDNAKKILSGVLYHYAKRGYEFIHIIQAIMRNSLDNLLTTIVMEAEQENSGVVLDKLKGFVGKGDNESVADIETTLKSYLEVFSYPEMQRILYDAPHKTSPAALNDGKTNLDIAIAESMLVTYQPFFRLVTMQILRHCESEFHEDDDRYTMLIFDEAARIGSINGLDAAMSTLRSKHTALICLFQSISQFKDIYPREKAQTLLNLCELKLFLSGSGDKDSTDYVSAMVGDYESTRMSYKRKGVLGGKSDGSYSAERRPIIEARDMMGLRELGEAIAFVYGHYIRCKKLRYFEDPYIAPILRQRQEEQIKLQTQVQAEPTNKEITHETEKERTG